jgi:hypothetical protein
MVFTLLFSVLLFTFFHESGHMMMGLLFGARITSFSVDFIGMSAHVGLDATFTPFQQAWVSIAGFGLPLLMTIIFLCSTVRRGNALLEWIKVLTAVITISSLLAWVVLPWIYMAGGRPGDDSITFIINTGIYPPVVSFGAVLLIAGALKVFFDRVEGPKGILSRLQASPANLVAPETRQTLAAMILVFALVTGLAIGLGTAFGTSKSNFLSPPADYTPAATVSLADHRLENEMVYSFSLEQPATVSLFFAMEGLTRGPGKIFLVGPGGYEKVFFMAGDKAGGNFTVHPRNLTLESGPYQVIVTFPQDPGVLKVYSKID